MRVANHTRADALQKSVITEFPSCDGLVVGVSRGFGDAGQKRLGQRVHEREQGLLCEPNAPDLACLPFQCRGNAFFHSLYFALASGQLSLNRGANEGARICEASLFGGMLNPRDQGFIQAEPPAFCSCFDRLHTLYGTTVKVRDRGVHDRVTNGIDTCTSDAQREEWATGKTYRNRATFLYVPLRISAAGIGLTVEVRARKSGKQLKSFETAPTTLFY